MNQFSSLGLSEPLLQAISACGYITPTPIQVQAIPPLLLGKDLLGCAQTGTGKTAAFALPVLQHLSSSPSRTRGKRPIRALVLTPTRELAAQIGGSFDRYGKFLDLSHHVIFGGVGQNPQVRALNQGRDILVACPGRLLDLVGQGFIDLSQVDFFVLDEADRMLDMGFIHDVRRVLRLLPESRQNLLFSATMPRVIVDLADDLLDSPVFIEVSPETKTVDRIDQTVMFVEKADKRRLLAEIIGTGDIAQALVFTRTKHGANRLVRQLDQAGIASQAIHGNKSQGARTRALDAFRDGRLSILVATDVASRGIDVDGVSHVFNFDLPNEPETYVHRIGRTGRAGRAGKAIAFCDHSEGAYLRDIERLIGESIPVDEDHAWHAADAIPAVRP
ncbi:MAG: DEAD/DEAH box helicase, partial [Oligoflexia bacterium]|nr:DEAD/DEAH box helicase [Oligoflexia bacterium]